MFEIKFCGQCFAVKCTCVSTMRACADCETYTPIRALIEKSDGRKICGTCQGKIERRAASKQQLEFFGQDSLFE